MGPTALLLLTSLLRSSSLQASVRVSPDQTQFFKLKSVSLSCDRDWTVTRNTSRETGTQCGVGWGTLTGSLCKISTLYSWDSGLYWCESREGQASDTVSIRVKDGGVVLQSPVRPVTEGQTVSLSCLHHTSSILPARFHRDGHFLSEQPTGHMTIQQVSVSDEGLYHCEIQGELSESSWLHVTPGKPTSPPPPTSTPLSFIKKNPFLLMWSIVGSVLGVLLLVLLVLLVKQCRQMKTTETEQSPVYSRVKTQDEVCYQHITIRDGPVSRQRITNKADSEVVYFSQNIN